MRAGAGSQKLPVTVHEGARRTAVAVGGANEDDVQPQVELLAAQARHAAPVPAQLWAGVSPVPAQMWEG